MITKIINLIKNSYISKVGNDAGQYPISQVSYFGKSGLSHEIYPYGMGAVAPTDSLCIMFNVGADDGNRAHIATNSNLRVKNLKEGEAYFGNLVTGTVTIFDQEGNWNVTVKKDGNITIDGNLNITVTGDANLTANNVELNANTVNMNAGTINANGSTHLGGGGAGIARIGDLVADISNPLIPIGIISTGSATNTAS